jgi:hypothetical protein
VWWRANIEAVAVVICRGTTNGGSSKSHGVTERHNGWVGRRMRLQTRRRRTDLQSYQRLHTKDPMRGCFPRSQKARWHCSTTTRTVSCSRQLVDSWDALTRPRSQQRRPCASPQHSRCSEAGYRVDANLGELTPQEDLVRNLKGPVAPQPPHPLASHAAKNNTRDFPSYLASEVFTDMLHRSTAANPTASARRMTRGTPRVPRIQNS